MATYIDPAHPIVREALTRHAAGIAAEALEPILTAALDRGMSRAEVARIASRALADGGPEGVLDRIASALRRPGDGGAA